jgi:hypothetical protein
MNINELESYKLSDAVKFRTELNPMLFTDQHMESDVREKLLEISNEFIDYLGINNLDIDDITVSGSNAAYTYTDHSDVDLHILVDMNKINNDTVYRELFIAKKNLFNDNHNIKIRGYDVEVYVQDKNQPVKSLGEYSVLNDKWNKFPTRQRSSIDQNSVKQKVTKLVQMAEFAKRSNNIDQINQVLSTIRRYRQAGLDKHGEFGPENIAFKILRTNGVIDDLYKHRNKLYSRQLSLDENGVDEDRHPNETPPGPEFKPTMPKGTVRVDVSDLYDWYKLGTNISNLDRANPSDFGKGPPSTIMAFGSEEEEHNYINALKRLGLETTDIDPLDPDQPKGMPRQKTDPTFNVAEASGYIPSESEKNDPRFKTALTVDVHPDTMKKNAAKLGWKIARDGRPPLLQTKTYTKLKESWNQFQETGNLVMTEQELEEVSMSPGALKAFSASDMASGMMAGFEAELVFSGAGGDSDDYDPEYEPDYDYDDRANSIESVIDFFSSGDFADLSGWEERRLRDRMINDYREWLDEAMMDQWDSEEGDYIKEWLKDNEPDLSDEELKDRWEEAISERNGDYESALDSYRDDWDGGLDEADWLQSNGLAYMSDVGNQYDLSWPHYTDVSGGPDEGGFSESAAETLAASLEQDLGVVTTVSGGYHSAKRDATTWIFEPDSSLDADESGDMPVEIVSPPMPLSEALEILPKFFEWAKSNGAYANKSTGFHMSVSMPGHEGDNLDYVKLALFLGDEYVLDQFGRSANTYARSAISKIRDSADKKLQEDSSRADSVLSTMRIHLNQLATKALASSSGFGKFTSINPKNNYIEFRSAGGSDYFADMKKIQNTLMRYARATNIAMNPEAEKQEYAKKLYKLLTKTNTQQVVDPKTGSKRTVTKSGNDDDAIAIFSRYVSGELPKSALKGFLKQIQYGREVKRQVAGGTLSKDYDPNGEYVIRKKESTGPIGPILHRFSATGSSSAMSIASDWAHGRGLEIPLHVAHIENVPPEILNAPVGQASSAADVSAGGGAVSGEQRSYVIYDRDSNRNIVGFMAPNSTIANERFQRYRQDHPRDNVDLRYTDSSAVPTSPVETEPQNFPAARQTGGEFTGRWKIVSGATGEVLHTFTLRSTDQSAANRVARDWAQRTRFDDTVEVYPEMG